MNLEMTRKNKNRSYKLKKKSRTFTEWIRKIKKKRTKVLLILDLG
jgi:hypothetical protein